METKETSEGAAAAVRAEVEAKRKSKRVIETVKAANDGIAKDQTANKSNNNVSDNETGSIGKRKRAVSSGSGPDVTNRVLADCPILRNWQRNGGPMVETISAWPILVGVKSHTEGLRNTVEGGGPDKSQQNQEKSRASLVNKNLEDLDTVTQGLRGGKGIEESSKRGQLKRPDLERVRRA